VNSFQKQTENQDTFRAELPLKTQSFFELAKKALDSFSVREKEIFLFLCILLIIGIFGSLSHINRVFLVEVPAPGGSFTEGVIGSPRFINPLLALSDADRDVATLVYSGLLRATPQGDLIPDLASSYTVSDDGMTYIFILREGLTWHDGKPLTSEDVVFTVTKIKDSALKSPRRASWEGVTVAATDDRTIQFTLEQPYSPFLENTTLGILPQHLWKDITSEQFSFSKYNVEPVGSGPYRITGVSKDSSGIPKYYDLKPFGNFSLGEPFIRDIRVRFYANEEFLLKALENKEVETINALRAEKVRELEAMGFRVEQYVLPRVFGIFFNQNQNTLFTNSAVRRALNESIDREKIIENVLFGYAKPLWGPLPPGTLGYGTSVPEKTSGGEDTGTSTPLSSIQKAREILLKDGWSLNEETGILEKKKKSGTDILTFAVSTSDTEELKRVANYIKETWEELGASVDLKIFNTGDLNQNVIRPRKYDALFFGEIIGRESDPFAFWHSSQRNDPGLNIALYTNITADSLLEKGRVSLDREERNDYYAQFEQEVAKDIPAVFVYSPDFVYILPHRIQGVHPGTIALPSERFLNIYTWYIETNKVWKFFIN